MNKYLLHLALIIVFTGCIREVEFKPKENAKTGPVFHMFINPDSTLRASFWRVTGILEDESMVADGSISIFKNKTLSGIMSYISDGSYLALNNLKSRDSFEVKVNSGLGSFSVNGFIPSAIQIIKVDTNNGIVPGDGKAFIFKLQFKDSAQYENNYRLFVTKKYYEYIYDFQGILADSVIKENILPIVGREVPFVQNNFNNYTSKEILFTDATFNGVKSDLEFYTTEKLTKNPSQRPLSLTVHLENIDENLYNFYNTRNAHLWQQQSITQIPGVVKGNISNGYGVIGAYTSAGYFIKLP